MKYYELLVKGNDKIGGVLFSPSDWQYPIARDGQPVKGWEKLTVTLQDGIYRHFHACTGGANMVSKEFKDLLESFIGFHPFVEFLPVKATNKLYGDKTFYILHFLKIYDVIDRSKTIFVKGTDSILKLRLCRKKVEKLKLFNAQPAFKDVIVSDDIRKAIIKEKLNIGLDFMRIYCGDEI